MVLVTTNMVSKTPFRASKIISIEVASSFHSGSVYYIDYSGTAGYEEVQYFLYFLPHISISSASCQFTGQWS